MPELVRFYIKHVLIGFAIAVVFVGGLLVFDVMGLRHLVFGSSDGILALVMLIFGNGVVFAGVQFAIAVMGLAEGRGPRGGRGRLRRLFSRPTEGAPHLAPVKTDLT